MTPVTLDKTAQTDFSLLDLIAKRYSPRNFSAEPLTEESVGSILEAARWSASSRNAQPWSFIVGIRGTTTFDTILNEVLMEGNQKWAQNAGLLVVTIALNASERPANMHDLGLAVQNMTLQALSQDIYVRQMGGIYGDKAQTLFNVPTEHRVMTGLAFGYLGDLSDLPENLQAREQAPRERKPLSEFVFEGTWGQTASLLDK